MPFQRVDTQDTKRLYSLLQSYIEDPSRAKAVKEVIIDASPWIYASTSKLPDYDELPTSMGYEELGDPPEIRLRRYARHLELGDETADQVVKILAWKRREYEFKLQKESEFAIATIILLFSLCENISTLYVAENLQQPVLDYMLRANYAQVKSPPLQKLKTVRFFAGARSDERFYAACDILQFIQLIHRLPALESVAMDGTSDYEADHQFFVPGTGNMKRLEITHCDISPGFLTVMISIPRALEEFKLSIGGLWTLDGADTSSEPLYIARALYAHRHSLRVLNLDVDVGAGANAVDWDVDRNYEKEDDGTDWEIKDQLDLYGRDWLALDKELSTGHKMDSGKEYTPTIGSLHGFPCLTHLSIGIMPLLGKYLGGYDQYEFKEPPYRLQQPAPFRLVDMLPPSLEYLCLYGYTRGENPDVDEHIDELLAKRDDKLPNLKVVRGIDERVRDIKDVLHDMAVAEVDEDELYLPSITQNPSFGTAPRMPLPIPRHHVKTGCRTCKARKIKCDEAKPSCKRCVSSRRVCGGYQGTASLTCYRPNQLSARDQREGRAFQFFTEMVGPVLSGPTDSYFWTHLVMQFSHFEPTMRHAVLSISSLYEEFARGSRITRQICGSTYAVDNYNAAIKHVKSASDEQMILVICVLFICIEYLQGDFNAAMQHCRHGIMILNNSSRPEWMCKYLVPIFRRLSITPFFFGGGKPPTPLPQLIGFGLPMPAKFSDTQEAQTAIDDLLIRIMGCLNDGNDDRVTLASLLDEWDSKMNDLEQELPPFATVDKYGICGMRFKHKMAKIYIQQPKSHTEMWWDQHIAIFRDAVKLAEQAFLLSTAPGYQRLRSSFSFEMSWLPMLFFIVLKCRDLEIRHIALSWLAQLGTAKEGLFDVGTLYRVGRRLIELEHDVSLDDTAEMVSTVVPPEERRYFAIPIKHELEVISEQDGTVRYRRQAKFLTKDKEGNVIGREEYIYDDKPRGCSIQIPPMRCAYRL
ncbi:hypothetical protein FDENT_8124 [Fusarium denticulatum]|uniref:Zn(2)-C6 fungal-type domain-containing protein n=1 Tax=Fusarium denticulatum TaxID=48507 RepID=A0A8H5U2I0_9HYPO|nr:hypothetical protein FDENT_8124 [Fusarium denticulatum]